MAQKNLFKYVDIFIVFIYYTHVYFPYFPNKANSHKVAAEVSGV